MFTESVIERFYVEAAVQENPIKAPIKRQVIKDPLPRGRSQPTKCIFCHQMFPTKTAAFSHVITTHKDARKCTQCKISFPNADVLKTHCDEIHKKIRKCIYCGLQTNQLREHMLKTHSKLILRCKHTRCRRIFKTNKEKLKHEKEDHINSKFFKCSYCKEEKYLRRHTFIKHIQKKHKDKTLYYCNTSSFCQKLIFFTAAEKLQHDGTVHKSNGIEIECKVCKQKLLWAHLNAHMRQFHNQSRTYTVSGETICCYCQKEFTSRKSAFRHVKEAHSKIETFKCYECEICFENSELKKEHYQKVHRGQFRCIYCVNWECTNRMNLRRHMRKKHQGEVIQCKYSNKCSLYFKTQADLQQHISESHEAAKSDKLQCIYCSKFLPSNDLTRHMKIHHKSVAIKCNFLSNCRTYFRSKEDLERHIQDVHQPGVALKKLKCPCCPDVFIDFERVQIHAKREHLQSIVKCNHKRCKFMCTGPKLLEIHMKTQHAEIEYLTNFQCSKCDYNNYSKLAMQNHQQNHDASVKLKCHFCPGKSFETKLSIQQHIKLIHSHFVYCRHCKNTISKFSMKKHCTVLRCQFCNKAYPCKSSRGKHERECVYLKSTL